MAAYFAARSERHAASPVITAGASLYIAGSSSAVPRPGRASSGYLLRSRSCAIAVDFGSGAFSRMREVFDPAQLDAILISHMHADHFFDIVPLRYALRYELRRTKPLPVYVPPGGMEVLQRIGRTVGRHGDFYAGVLDVREYEPHRRLAIKGCSVRFAPAVHYIPAYAMRIEMGGAVLGYSADTAPCDEIVDLVRDAGVFLCEAALGPDGKESGRRGHLNAEEAGTIAKRAGVRLLLLTHYGAQSDPKALHSAAARTFSGEIRVADDGMNVPMVAVTTSRRPQCKSPRTGDDSI